MYFLCYSVPRPSCFDALRLLLSHQVGIPGFDSMPSALNRLSKHERASYCNRYWENQFKKVWVFKCDCSCSRLSIISRN